MGMSIEEAIERYESNAEYERTHGNLQGCLEFRQLIEWLRKYQQLRADYENRLKDDMVAMLIELKNEFIDKSWNIDMYDDDLDFECCYLNDIDEIIQQKIDKCKAESEKI